MGMKYYADGLVLRKYSYSIELQIDDIVILELSKLENMRERSIVLVDFNNKTVEELSVVTNRIIQYEIRRYGIYALYAAMISGDGKENWSNITDRVSISVIHPENIDYNNFSSFMALKYQK